MDIPDLDNNLKPGDTVTVVFRRDGKEQKVDALSRLIPRQKCSTTKTAASSIMCCGR